MRCPCSQVEQKLANSFPLSLYTHQINFSYKSYGKLEFMNFGFTTQT